MDQSLTQYLTPQFLKKVTQTLLSFSLFTFIFSYSSWFSNFQFYFTSFPFKLLTHTLEKNYTFLICNAIVVFIANASGLLYSHSGFDLNEHNDGNNILSTKQSLLVNEAVLEKVEEEKEEGSVLTVDNEEQEGSFGFGNTIEVREEEEGKESLTLMIKDATSGEYEEMDGGFGFEEQEEDEIWGLSKEELNKKCEDFIRKMKEGIRFESQRQLFMV